MSVTTTGPMGSISIDLETGSVVVPGTSETIASAWLVSAFIRLDLPELRLPKIDMCTRSLDGVWLRVVISFR